MRAVGVKCLAVFALAALPILPQSPHVRSVDLYGARKISRDRILRAAQVHPGGVLPGSKGDMEERLSEVPGIVAARVEAVCCDGAEIDLFIGIMEQEGPQPAFRSEPSGEARLPEELAATYGDYVVRLKRAGHNRAAADTRDFQQRFSSFSESHADELRQVLRTAAEPEQRAIAATVLGFGPKKQGTVDDLLYALQDPDEQVRENTLDSLRILAALAVRQPSLGLQLAPTWAIELLNSLVLGDRVQAADLLITLTDRQDPTVLGQLRARALPALVEMARWQTLRYALPPFLLLGRVAGIPDTETQRRWSSGERELVIQRALAPTQRKR